MLILTKWPIVYFHVTLNFVLVHNKPITMSVKRSLYFDIQPPATSFGLLASCHHTVYEYEQHRLTITCPGLLKVEIWHFSYMLSINVIILNVTKPFRKKIILWMSLWYSNCTSFTDKSISLKSLGSYTAVKCNKAHGWKVQGRVKTRVI